MMAIAGSSFAISSRKRELQPSIRELSRAHSMICAGATRSSELSSTPRHGPTKAVEAHRILASAYFTHGKYKKALAQVDAILALRPADSDALSSRPVIAILAESPDQELAGRHTTVELRD